MQRQRRANSASSTSKLSAGTTKPVAQLTSHAATKCSRCSEMNRPIPGRSESDLSGDPDTGIARNGCRFAIFSCIGPDTYGWKPRWFDSDPPEFAYPTEKLGRSRELEGFFRYLLEADLRSGDQGGTERCGSAGGRSGNHHCCCQTDGGVQVRSANWFL